MENVQARMQAARGAIAAIGEADAKAAQSKIQATALMEELKGANLTALQRADVSAAILEVGFADSDAHAICSAMAKGCKGQRAERQDMQDYSALKAYFTEREWKTLTAKVSRSLKVLIVFERAWALGCACPTEHTKTEWAALIDTCQGVGATSNLEATLKELRAEWKRFVRAAKLKHGAVAGLSKLPELPSELPSDIMQRVFKEDAPPVDPRVEVPSTALVRMRDRGNSKRDVPTVTIGSGLPTLAGAPAETQMFASFVMQGFKSFQDRCERTDRILETMLLQKADGENKFARRHALPNETPAFGFGAAKGRAAQGGIFALEDGVCGHGGADAATAATDAAAGAHEEKHAGAAAAVNEEKHTGVADAADATAGLRRLKTAGDAHAAGAAAGKAAALADIDALMAAMDTRSDERVKARAEERTRKKLEGDGAVSAPARGKGSSKAGKLPCKTTRKVKKAPKKPSAHAVAKAAAAVAEPKKAAGSKHSQKATWNDEKSRSQLQCRGNTIYTSKGKNFSIKYGGCHGQRAVAVRAADTWLAAQKISDGC